MEGWFSLASVALQGARTNFWGLAVLSIAGALPLSGFLATFLSVGFVDFAPWLLLGFT